MARHGIDKASLDMSTDHYKWFTYNAYIILTCR